MIREVVVDTETTGLDPAAGHRLVEVAAIELINYVPTGRIFHSYVDPGRDVPEEAVRVHGLNAEFLAEFPKFEAVAPAFLAFVGDSQLIIHNAAFDVLFLNHELTRCGLDVFTEGRAVDTLALALRKHPGAPASLDALCRRFGVNTSARTRHGALLDSELLAEVYLHLIGGRQADLGFASGQEAGAVLAAVALATVRPARPHGPSEAELLAHGAFVAGLSDPVWLAA